MCDTAVRQQRMVLWQVAVERVSPACATMLEPRNGGLLLACWR